MSSSNPTTSSHQESPQATREKAKQQRPGRACDTCRRRKVKCEGGFAAEGEENSVSCTLCIAQGIPCTYEQRTTKRGPPKGYVESLERRLEAMEALLAQFASKEGASTAREGSTETPPSVARSTGGLDDGSIFPTPATPGSDTPAATGLDAIDELSMKLNDLNIERNRFIGRGSGLHLLRSMEQYAEPSATSILEPDVVSTVETLWREEHELRFRQDVVPLPSEHLAKRLIDAAFNDHQVRWVIPRAFFDDCMRRGMIESDRSFKGLYYAVLALGSRSVPNTMDSARSSKEARIVEGWTWFKASIAASETPLESATLFSLLRTTILAMWQLGSAGFVTVWGVVGWGIRQAIDAGAHSEDRADWTVSPLRNQLRKRAFITLVSLDYYISTNLGRPFAIHEEDWDVTPPLSISDEDLLDWDRRTSIARLNGEPLPPQPPTSSESSVPGSPTVPVHSGGYPWKSMMVLYAIMARTMKSLYGMRRDKTLKGTKEAVRDLDSRLNAWLENVPDHVRWNPGQQDDETLLLSAAIYSAYYSNQILVHREFISPSRSAALDCPSLAIVSNAARSSAHVLDTLRQRGLLRRAYAYAPLVAVQDAWILLLGRFASPDANAQLTPSAAADVKRCINVLHDLAPTCYMALHCYEGMVKLASLVTAPPSARRGTNSLSNSANKRSADWTDGQSPTGSQSDRPSPSASGDSYTPGGSSVEGGSHKQRKLHPTATHRAMPLPLSTSDLSSQTFKGRPTFAADDSTAPTIPPSSIPVEANGMNGNAFYSSDIPTSAALDAASYSNLYPPTTLTNSQFSSSVAPDLAVLNSLPNPPYPQTSLPSDQTFAPFDPNLSTPLASQLSNVNALDSFDFGTDFFSFSSSSAANGSTVVNDPHVPAEINRAATELWNTFSAANPMSLEDPISAGTVGNRSSWNPLNFSNENMFGGGAGGGPMDSNSPAASFDPFSHWNFSSPSASTLRNDGTDSSSTNNGQWNYYDPSTFGSTN